ncbi:superoxide dismutase [Mn] [Arthrobacter sp. Hiyo8]|nr:superoxide dismutase [Mn] [Arthrobacter sp. Hiyo8]
MTEYVLPELGYDYAALEPHISAKIMELHHSKHHAAYVAGANNALAQLAEARDKGDFANINRLSKDLAFHTGGHINHSVFWNNISPDGGDKPEGELAAAIDDAFGSFDAFRAQFSAAALGLQGSGWASLPTSPSAATSSSSSSTTSRAMSQSAPRRCSCWTCGSTLSTWTTSTSRPTMSRPSGTSSTGPTSQSASKRPARTPPG